MGEERVTNSNGQNREVIRCIVGHGDVEELCPAIALDVDPYAFTCEKIVDISMSQRLD